MLVEPATLDFPPPRRLTVPQALSGGIVMSTEQTTSDAPRQPDDAPLPITDSAASGGHASDYAEVNVQQPNTVKFDQLGPVVVNSDGVSFGGGAF